MEPLYPSPMDFVHSATVVNTKLHEVRKFCLSVGDSWPEPISDAQRKAFKTWRGMCERHAKGDLRHTLAEVESQHIVAQWLIDRWQAVQQVAQQLALPRTPKTG